MTVESKSGASEADKLPKISDTAGHVALGAELLPDRYDVAVGIVRNLQDETAHLERSLRAGPIAEDVTQYVGAALKLNRFMIGEANNFPDTYIGKNKPPYSSAAIAETIVAPMIGNPVDPIVIRTAFEHEEEMGGLHDLIITALDDSPVVARLSHPHMKLLTQAYGVANFPELFAKLDMGNPFDKAVRGKLLEPQRLDQMCYCERPVVAPRSGSVMYQAANQAFFASIAKSILPSISAELSEALAQTVTRRHGKGGEMFNTVVAQIERIGPERADRLKEVCGTTLFGSYTDSQVDLLCSIFLDHDEANIDRLKGGDIRLVLINAAGDDSGILNNVPAQYEDSENATIFLEVESFKGIYESFVKLRKLGLQPSSVVFAQHSTEGQMNLFKRGSGVKKGHGQGMFVASPKFVDTIKPKLDEQDADGFSFERDGVGFKRLVGAYMQSSKKTGFKQIIFHGCEMGKHTVRKIDDGEPADTTETSVVLEFAKIIVDKDDHIKIYAFGDNMALHKTPDGLAASAPEAQNSTTSFDMTLRRQPFDTTLVEIDHGAVSEKFVSVVPLQK